MKIIYIKENSIDLSVFETEDTEFRVDFDPDLAIDPVISLTNHILDWEESTGNKKNINLNFKGFSAENLVKLYQHYLKRETLVNNSLILNINILINGYNTLDDSLFESALIYETDLEQLLDIKLDLSGEIKEFQSNLTKWYLACLKSMHKVEYTYLDTVTKIPSVYKKIISSSNLLTLSQIFSKAQPINTADLPLVEEAYPTIMSAASVSAIADKLIQNIKFNI